MVPALRSGHDVIGRDNAYALFEMLHAVRDNINLDLSGFRPCYFKTCRSYHLISHYPASYPAPEGEYRITRRERVRGAGPLSQPRFRGQPN